MALPSISIVRVSSLDIEQLRSVADAAIVGLEMALRPILGRALDVRDWNGNTRSLSGGKVITASIALESIDATKTQISIAVSGVAIMVNKIAVKSAIEKKLSELLDL